MLGTFNNLRDRQCDAHIQDEVTTARSIKQNHPELTWTECLKLSKEAWDKQPIS